MNDWWKAPVLQGPENDYGDYDYLIEEIPQNTREWSTWGYKCSECGKYHRLNVVYTAYFYTLDGYDSMDTEVCWLCEMKSAIRKPLNKMKRKIKTFNLAKELYDDSNKTFKHCYELAKKIVRQKGAELIKISKSTTKPTENKDIWSYPIDELDYLLETADGKEFLLWDNRLYEKENQYENIKRN